MFTRRFRKTLARICVALLCMQAGLSAYACPAFLLDLEAAAAPAVHHEAPPAEMAADCGEHAQNTADKAMCHQHYAGDQSVGGTSLASASAAPSLPLTLTAMVEPAMRAGTVLPVLLQRDTAPPLPIRFLVLRI